MGKCQRGENVMIKTAEYDGETYWLMIVRNRVANHINDFSGHYSAKRAQRATGFYELNVCKRSDPLNYLYSDVKKKEADLVKKANTIAKEIRRGHFRWKEGKC